LYGKVDIEIGPVQMAGTGHLDFEDLVD